MQHFDWSEVASDELAAMVCEAAGCDPRRLGGEVRALLADLLRAAGGVPVAEEAFSDAASTRIGIGLIDDALREAFAKDLIAYEATAAALGGPAAMLASEIALVDLVHVNWCSEAELDKLPRLGKALAHQIVEERRRGGAFLGGHDLAARVPGIGEHTIVALQQRLRFGRRPTALPTPAKPGELIKLLVSRTGVPGDQGLRRVLEHAISHAATTARTRWFAAQRHAEDAPATPHGNATVGVLRGSEYYRWLATGFASVGKTIDMAMFHIAMPEADHPTRTLVDGLIAAQRRGVRVRVLLDRDRPTDPYGSTLINAPAIAALQAGGVSVRVDLEDQLLHSKCLVLDGELAVIGSHNWSAGSYFAYDDVTLAIRSDSLAAEFTQRFEALWAAGT